MMSNQVVNKSASIAEEFKNLTEKEARDLISAAELARVRAYCPYSKFRVGSAVLTEDGTTISGCNVENASYGLTICAERNAVCRAVGEGHRRFKAIAVVADVKGRFVSPCGACRQVMAEFGVDYEVYLAMPSDGPYIKTTMERLLPDSFSPADLTT